MLTVFAALIIVLGLLFASIIWRQNKQLQVQLEQQQLNLLLEQDAQQLEKPQQETIVEQTEPRSDAQPSAEAPIAPYASWPFYLDPDFGISFHYPISTFAKYDEDLPDPVLRNVHFVPREFRNPDSSRDIRFTINRNVKGLSAHEWITQGVPQATLLEPINGFTVATYVADSRPITVAIRIAQGNVYFFTSPSAGITDELRVMVETFSSK